MLGHCDNNSQKQFLSQQVVKVWHSLHHETKHYTNYTTLT